MYKEIPSKYETKVMERLPKEKRDKLKKVINDLRKERRLSVEEMFRVYGS